MDGNDASIRFVQARDHIANGLHKPPLGIVLHDMEAPEKGTTAESVALYFQHPSRTGSAHYCIDNNSIVQCVRDADKAAQAPGTNSTHLGFEHAGYASQTAADWSDPFSAAMLKLSAAFARFKCLQYGIPMVFLTIDDLKAGNIRGITTHNNVSLAFRRSTHTDPGAGFPIAGYMNDVVRGTEPAKKIYVAKPWPGKSLKANDRDDLVPEIKVYLAVLGHKVDTSTPARARTYGTDVERAIVAEKVLHDLKNPHDRWFKPGADIDSAMGKKVWDWLQAELVVKSAK